MTGLRVLVVDDEPVARLTASKTLRYLGYDVLEAADGVEAVEIYRRECLRIDLVLMDMVMPRMNGSEAFAKIREINSDAKVVILSGYTRDVNIEELLRDGLVASMGKPYRQSEIAHCVANALARDDSEADS